MTKRKEGVSFVRAEKLSRESAATRRIEADWRRRKKRCYHSRCCAQCRNKKKEEEVTRVIQKKESKQKRDPRTQQKERGDGDRTHEFWPKPCWLKLALPPSLRTRVLLDCVGMTPLCTRLVELVVQVGARSEGRLKPRSVVSAQRV